MDNMKKIICTNPYDLLIQIKNNSTECPIELISNKIPTDLCCRINGITDSCEDCIEIWLH